MQNLMRGLLSTVVFRWSLLAIFLIVISGVIYMAYDKIKNPWAAYIDRPPRTLRLELGMPYDEFIEKNAKDVFSKSNLYKGSDDNLGFYMSPFREPNKSTVIIEYGFPRAVFILPRSTFVSTDFVAGHLWSVSVKPLLYPVKREEALRLADNLIKMFNNSGLDIFKDKPHFTLEEVKLRMQLPMHEMDFNKFPVGNWQRKEFYGVGNFQLLIEPLDPSLSPAEQLYSVNISITGQDLYDRLLDLVKEARRRIPLVGKDGPCSPESYQSCEYDDMRIYLNALRKAGLSPLKPQ